MEYIFTCPICSLEYKRSFVVPQVLDCGHTFCSSCIKRLQSNPFCPNCRSDIQRENQWIFPTNYSLLSLIEETQSVKNSNVDIVCRIHSLKEKYFIRKDLLNKEKNEIKKSLQVISDKLERLRTLEDCGVHDYLGKEVRKTLAEMEEEYREFPNNNILHFEDLDHYATFSKKKERTTKALLRELYEALHSEKVYAFKRIGKKLKFGMLNIRDNKILIHSLTLDEIPKGSKTVPFDDMKNDNLWFYAFLNIRGGCRTSHVIQIQLVGNNKLPRFVKLFTGENGHSYANGIFRCEDRDVNKFDLESDEECLNNSAGNPVVLKSIFSVIIPEEIQMDYYVNVPSIMSCDKESLIVREISVNSFQLMEVCDAGRFKILGRVVYPFKSSDILNFIFVKPLNPPCKILDCGVLVKIFE